MTEPTFDDVLAARERVYQVIRPTGLLRHPLLAELAGFDLYVKHENHNPTGAFKVRGGLNLIGSLPEAERASGVMTASTGNHGQSVAFAGRRFGIACTIVVPQNNNPEKNRAMQALGATLIEHGRDFDEAREYCEQLAGTRGLRYVHSANEPLLIAGVGTYALEVFDDLPHIDVVFVPVGGGSGAAGLGIVRSALHRRTRIIGVQAAGADTFTRSWRTGTRVAATRVDTIAEGVATRTTFDLTFDILQRELDDIVTLSEDELMESVRVAVRTTHNLAEAAGAAPVMAALKVKESLRNRTVVAVMSGGNLDSRLLSRLFCYGIDKEKR
ncbi:MAG: threonine dehydratase [Acidobacteria bacterium]|nr:MAG: threonine dehydratase [Acidobacteriota bacterium]